MKHNWVAVKYINEYDTLKEATYTNEYDVYDYYCKNCGLALISMSCSSKYEFRMGIDLLSDERAISVAFDTCANIMMSQILK